MWHSVASTPVAWCILMTKMLWVRVTQHGWYRMKKPPSITKLSEETSQYIGILGFSLSTVQLQCHITCFNIHRLIDMALSSKKAQTSLQSFQPENRLSASSGVIFNIYVQGVWMELYILKKEGKFTLCKTRSHLDEVFDTLYPARNNKHRHRSVRYPHTLSLSTYRTCSSSRLLSQWLTQTCDKSVTLINFHLLSDMCRELALTDHNTRTTARSGHKTIPLLNKGMQCLASWAKLDLMDNYQVRKVLPKQRTCK